MKLFRQGVLVAAVLVAVGAAATSATAGPTYSVLVGTTSAVSGTHSDTGASQLVLTDVTSPYGYVISCTEGAATGNFPNTPAARTGIGIMVLAAANWTSCSGNAPAMVSYSATLSTRWSFDVTAVSTGSATFTVGNIDISMFASGCEFDVVGNTDATFTNQTQRMAYAPVAGSGHVLTANNVTGCFGLISHGDQIKMTATYVVAARTATGVSGPLKFTSP